MSFSDEMDARLAATSRAEQDQRQARQAADRAAEAELARARARFTGRVAEATEYLRSRGARPIRVVSIQRGMRSSRIEKVYPFSVIAVGDIALRDGRLLSGSTEEARVGSLLRGVRKRDIVFNGGNTFTGLEVRNGQLLVARHWAEHVTCEDADEWLLAQTEAAAKRLRLRHR